MTPASILEKATQLIVVDILGPVVGALGDHAQDVLGHKVGGEPAHPSASNGAHDEPAAGPHKGPHLLQEGTRVVNVLDDFEDGDDIVSGAWLLGHLEVLYRAVAVGQLGCEGRILARVGAGDGKHLRRGVDGGDGARRGQAGGALGEDAAAAANVEVGEEVGGGAGGANGALTGSDEVVAKRVHEMEEARGAVCVPPVGGEVVEVGDFIWVDRGCCCRVPSWRQRRG